MYKNLKLSMVLYCIASLSPNSHVMAAEQFSDKNASQVVRTFTVPTIQDIQVVFTSVLSVLGILVGFSFFITIVYGGIQFLLSGGDPKAVAAAKGTLTWGILGLAVFALSYTILLLLEAFTGVKLTIFKLTGF